MALLGEIIKKSITLINLKSNKKAVLLQKKQLGKLLDTAKDTEFGNFYRFRDFLHVFDHENYEPLALDFYEKFKANVPIFNYESIFTNWWSKALDGKKNVIWPGKIPYFALSSGTSENSSKYIPVTKQQIKAIRKTGRKQILSLKNFDFDAITYEKSILMLGGSTQLIPHNESLEGDLSGILMSNLPIWIRSHYKPGQKIAEINNWGEKLEKIVEEAPNWDIAFVAGVPAWIQILLEKIIAYHKLKNIHEVWPNLASFCHGGVAFEPYKASFNALLGQPIKYIETYLASEGFIAYQENPNSKGMKLVLDGGIFYEFIPFNDKNFDTDGNLKPNCETLMISDTFENQEYALLISTSAGAWRYLIGDTIKFVDKTKSEIIITGRTKHYLSICGEHLSIDNMNTAIHKTSQEFNLQIKEFTVVGLNENDKLSHEWFIGCNQSIDNELFAKHLDENLKIVNDDYKTERLFALKNVKVTVLPEDVFYNWLKQNGKEGGQIKFPRVLRNEQWQSWKNYLEIQKCVK